MSILGENFERQPRNFVINAFICTGSLISALISIVTLAKGCPAIAWYASVTNLILCLSATVLSLPSLITKDKKLFKKEDYMWILFGAWIVFQIAYIFILIGSALKNNLPLKDTSSLSSLPAGKPTSKPDLTLPSLVKSFSGSPEKITEEKQKSEVSEEVQENPKKPDAPEEVLPDVPSENEIKDGSAIPDAPPLSPLSTSPQTNIKTASSESANSSNPTTNLSNSTGEVSPSLNPIDEKTLQNAFKALKKSPAPSPKVVNELVPKRAALQAQLRALKPAPPRQAPEFTHLNPCVNPDLLKEVKLKNVSLPQEKPVSRLFFDESAKMGYTGSYVKMKASSESSPGDNDNVQLITI